MIFNELDLLEIRLNELSDVVDLFVLTEATQTHTGKPKHLYYKENKERFSKFPIVNITVDGFPEGLDAWGKEKYQRAACLGYLQTLGLTNDDTVLFSDIDEIFKSSRVLELAHTDGWKSAGMAMFMFYYYLNCFNSDYSWNHPRMVKGDALEISLTRWGTADTMFCNTGWHFSYLGDVQEKLGAFAHTEYDVPPFNTEEYIAERKRNCKSLFDDKTNYTIIENLDFLPEYVKNNLGKFSEYITTEQTL